MILGRATASIVELSGMRIDPEAMPRRAIPQGTGRPGMAPAGRAVSLTGGGPRRRSRRPPPAGPPGALGAAACGFRQKGGNFYWLKKKDFCRIRHHLCRDEAVSHA